MNLRNTNAGSTALTKLEVLIIIAILLLPGTFILGALGKSRAAARSACCNCNMKQVGLAFRMYSNDHNDRFPWRVPASETGSLEYALSPQTFQHYLVASNELNTPKILWCSTDSERSRSSEWSRLSNLSISYLVGIDSDESEPQMILSGDRNITGGILSNGVMSFAPANGISFTKAMHNGRGNVGLADGSAQQLSTADLQKHLSNSMMPVIRLAIP